MLPELAAYQERIDEATSKQAALRLAIEAAEKCMDALKLADKKEKPSLKADAKRWLDEAERIKGSNHWSKPAASTSAKLDVNPHQFKVESPKLSQAPQPTRELPTSEKLLLAKASKLNGFVFPPWTAEPSDVEFELEDGAELFTDIIELPLSAHQRKFLDGWKRAKYALPPPSWVANGTPPATLAVTPEKIPTDLVQDAAADCSVVASLCALASRGERGHKLVMYTSIWPRDNNTNRPRPSKNGKYVLKLNFNGCWRRVVIDDKLPVSKTIRMLHVIDKNNPGLLWPPLIEKAYLKVRGGYDFPGSNSCSDLWTLIGWIPEQVFLQDADVVPDKLWRRVYQAFKHGDVLVTVGTGTMKRSDERELGLESQHNYAVLDLKEDGDGPMLQIKNPWIDGKGWNDPRSRAHSGGAAGETTSEGVFWISLSSVMQYFESVFLNWNPGLFPYREDVHFRWNVETGDDGTRSVIDNPQYAITTHKKGLIWFLLCRHFRDGDLDNVPESSEHDAGHSCPGSGADRSRERYPGFVSLSIYDRNGERIYVDEGDLERGPYVNTPQALLCWECPAGATYTVVVNHQDLPSSSYTFTLSVFSEMKATIAPAEAKYLTRTKISGCWTAATAGGNTQSPRYGENPQFALTVPVATPIALLMEADAQQVPINAQILHGRGERVYTFKNQDIVMGTGTYRHRYAFAEMPLLSAGKYTIVCSTFEPGQLAKFHLSLDADHACTIRQVPKDGAGMLPLRLQQACFGSTVERIAASIIPHRLTRVTVVTTFSRTRSLRPSVEKSRSPLRVAIELGRIPGNKVLVESNNGEFSGAETIRTDVLDISPELTRSGDMFLVLERLRGPADGSEELYDVQIYHDATNALTVGFWRNWD